MFPSNTRPSTLPIQTFNTVPFQKSKLLNPAISTISGCHPYHHRRRLRSILFTLKLTPPSPSFNRPRSSFFHYRTPVCSASSDGPSVEQLEYVQEEADDNGMELDSSGNGKTKEFKFDPSFDSIEMKRIDSPVVEVKELDELPEQWRRSKLAWLCKELPAHKGATVIRVLNAQRKWMRQEDATYVAVHCTRIRENETGFRVYKWMTQQHWFRFDFAFATKLADYMGKDRKYLKCREIFDDIINQGRVPAESTFHMLIISYLSSSDRGCIEEACSIYNRMIQLGGYKPQPHLHNSLSRALVSGPGRLCKHYLKQAEFIFHNLATSGLKIHKDVYYGLIWLHSFQDSIDKERIAALRAEMRSNGIQEDQEVLVSVLRAYSKDGDIEGAEKTWKKLLSHDNNPPPPAFLYAMELYSLVGEPMKSLELFRRMQEANGPTNVAFYHKIIEVICKAQNTDLAESLMEEFINSGLKPMTPAFMKLVNMYSDLGFYDKLEAAFFLCLEKCQPNRAMYNIYLDSLVQRGNVDRAEGIFRQMYGDGRIGINSSSCSSILRCYLSRGEYVKAAKINDLMRQKNYDVKLEPQWMEKLDYALSLKKNVPKAPIKSKLSKEQREIIVGMLLGGLQIITTEKRKKSVVIFEFDEKLESHSVLRRHVYDQYHDWLAQSDAEAHDSEDVPYYFTTIPHAYFRFYAEQFLPDGKPVIPRLLHRWLSAPVLAYWYMYGGHRTLKGDILLQLKGSQEGVERIVASLKEKSLDCRMRKRGSVYWIGFLGSNSQSFWALIEPFVLDDLKHLQTNCISSNGTALAEDTSFGSGSEDDENVYGDSVDDNYSISY